MDSDGTPDDIKDYEFRSKNTFQKLWFLSAGVIMNFILSFIHGLMLHKDSNQDQPWQRTYIILRVRHKL